VSGKISEAIDIVLLKTETMAIIAGMTNSTATSSATGTTTRRCISVCNQSGRPAIGEKFFI
jgi:hypothetical protein